MPELRAIAQASHLSFMDGMHMGFMVAAGVALVAAVLAVLVKAGHATDGASVHAA